MRNWIQSLFGRRPKTSRRLSQFARLSMEGLENRAVPASLGLKTAVLDFGGQAITANQMALGGWGNIGATTVNGFTSLFVANAPLNVFDVTGNGVVNQADATAAINSIVARVRADFAPYQIQILAADFTNEAGRLVNPMLGDAFMFVTGGQNNVETDFSINIFGVAPVDDGNVMDNIGFAFGQNIAGASSSPADMINRFARTISHEMGHTFGLHHITETAGDPVSHHLMNAPNDGVDPRDFSRDFVFMDDSFETEVGLQNSHRILSDPFVLGESANSWIAVLRPGELTITGRDVADNVTLNANASNSLWNIGGIGAVVIGVTRESFSVFSHNPFDAPVNQIRFSGRGGNDVFTANANLMTSLLVNGGDGNDSITGGSAPDILRGGEGNDTIRGGAGNDFIRGLGGNDVLFGDGGDDFMQGDDGNDTIRGGNNNDTLRGGDGLDRLFGEAGNDTLDGGDEFFPMADILTGGTGFDTFFQHQGFVPFLFNEDILTDRQLFEPVINE